MWTVLVEVEGDLGEPGIDRSTLEGLLRELGTSRVAVGYGPRRYSARFSVDGDDVADAVANAVAVYRAAVARTDLPSWPVVRLEVFAESDVPARGVEREAAGAYA